MTLTHISPYSFLLLALHYKGYVKLTNHLNPDNEKVLLCLESQWVDQRTYKRLFGTTSEDASDNRTEYLVFELDMPDDEYELWKEDIAFFKNHCTREEVNWKVYVYTDVIRFFLKGNSSPALPPIAQMLNNTPFLKGENANADINALLNLTSNITHTQISLLHLQKGDTLYNPFGGCAYASHKISSEVNYEGYTSNYSNYIFGKIYLRCSRESDSCNWNFSTELMTSKKKHDYILLNFGPELSNINCSVPMGMTHTEFIGLDNPIIMEMVNRLSDQGRMTFIIPKTEADQANNATLKYLMDNDLLDTITEMYGYTILLINKHKETPHWVKCIPQTDSRNRLKRISPFSISTLDIKMADYRLNIGHYLLNKIKSQPPYCYKAVKLSELLRPIKLETARDFPYIAYNRSIQPKNYPYNYTITASHFQKQHSTSADSISILNKDLLLISFSKTGLAWSGEQVIHNLIPYWFSVRSGRLGYAGGALFCEIAPCVDIAYLILHLNEPYFKEQIAYYGFDPNIDKWFFDLYVYMPDCETSIERQHELVTMAKTKYVKMFAESIDIHLQDIYTGEQTYLPNGTLLKNNRYQITGSLGHGGFGRTYTATDRYPDSKNDKTVAIKEFFSLQMHTRNRRDGKNVQPIPERFNEAKMALIKFQNEIEAIQSCHSEYIIKVYDVFHENSTSYYTMEYIDNINLYDYCKNHALSEHEALRITLQLCSALNEIHRKGILHLDIKPQNILLTPHDYDVRLIDFGMSHYLSENRNESVLIAQSSNFSAPELQYRALGKPTKATDIYSVGATLRYMLHPQQTTSKIMSEESVFLPNITQLETAETPPDNMFRPDAPNRISSLEDVINYATQYNPRNRPQTVGVLEDLLRQID